MTLTLTITTPAELVLAETEVEVVRSEDETGSFGIMAGHADLLTMTRQAIVRWRTAQGERSYCAIEGGLLLVAEGTRVHVAARQARRGDDLEKLEQDIAEARKREEEQTKQERVAATRLHTQAVRSLVAHLRDAAHLPGGGR